MDEILISHVSSETASAFLFKSFFNAELAELTSQ